MKKIIQFLSNIWHGNKHKKHHDEVREVAKQAVKYAMMLEEDKQILQTDNQTLKSMVLGFSHIILMPNFDRDLLKLCNCEFCQETLKELQLDDYRHYQTAETKKVLH